MNRREHLLKEKVLENMYAVSVPFLQSSKDSGKSKPTGKFGLPARYDKSYRINFVIKPPLSNSAKGKGKSIFNK